MEESLYTLRDLEKVFGWGYHLGTEDGKIGVPKDFVSYYGDFDWWAEAQCKRQDETFSRLDEFLNWNDYHNPDGTLKERDIK